jgi:hypothetical protein
MPGVLKVGRLPAPTRGSRLRPTGRMVRLTDGDLDLPPPTARFLSRPNSEAPHRESEAAPMLPPFIIDQIRRREEEERRRIERDRPRVELPVDAYRPAPQPQRDEDEEDDPERGVVILDLG